MEKVRPASFFLTIFLASVLAGCGVPPAEPTDDAVVTPAPSACADDVALTAAVDVLMSAASGEGSIPVYGADGGRGNNLLERLKRSDVAAIANPLGEGVLVSVIYGGDRIYPSGSQTAHRAAWLALDGTLYPVDVDAAQAFDLRWDGYPEEVKARTGLGEDYFGLDSYGFSDFTSWNSDRGDKFESFLVEATGLCSAPTPWG